MRPLLSRAQIAQWEASFMQAGVSGALLMENAGRGAAHIIGLRGKPRLEAKAKPSMMRGSCVRCADEQALAQFRVMLLVGPGNNGGDGYVVARHLLARAAQVTCVSIGTSSAQKASGSDALKARCAFEAVGGEVHSIASLAGFHQLWNSWSMPQQGDALVPPVLVDALFGSGLNRGLNGVYREVIEAVNQWSGVRLALDLPSGLCADTGSALEGIALKAEQTITFGHLKQGLLTTAGLAYGGRVTLSHIGVPAAGKIEELEVSSFLLEADDLLSFLRPREATTHKGKLPRVAVWGGTAAYAGAARLSGLGALRAGAGLTTIVTTQASASAYHNEALELMTQELSLDSTLSEKLAQFSSLVLGPGLGRRAADQALYAEVLKAVLTPTPEVHEKQGGQGAILPKPLVVLDADALYFLAQEPCEFSPGAVVLTPHPKEAARLLGISTKEVEADRFAAVRALAQRYHAVVLLKGPRSLISDGKKVGAIAWGSPALATPGSGDVLSGVLASLWAEAQIHQGNASLVELAFQATALAASLHALAGEQWAEQHGDAGLLASELAQQVTRVKYELLEARPPS